MLIIVVDYGVGNLRSISKSLEKTSSDSNLNCSIKVSSTITDIKKADKILKLLSPEDIGQGIVIENGLVLGIETLQGTNELLKFVVKIDNGVI